MKKNTVNKTFAVLCGAVALIYLLNPTAGILEIIPDNFPIVGNLDEGAAALILFSSLKYLGIDLTGLFTNREKED